MSASGCMRKRRHTHNTRGSQLNFLVPSAHRPADVTFYRTAILEWNNIPSEFKHTNTLALFKKRVKQELAAQARSREQTMFV